MAGIKDYSTTNLNNTSLNGISVAEGMLPSNLNNAIRALMVNTRSWYNDSQWVEYGDGDGAYTATYASGTSFTIAGVDVTPIYHEGRRIKLTATTPGTIYGTISSSTFSTDTTINVTWDSGSLSNEAIDNVYIGGLSKTNNSLPTGVIATATLADGSVTTVKIADSAVTTAKINDAAVTNAKLGADSVDGSKIADDSIDSEHYVDGSIDTAHIADSQITTSKIADSNITTAKIADSNVTTDKLASDAVTTVKITDANVTSGKIAADAIDGSKIADDSIDSEHYVDGSIDTAHIGDSQITTVKLASNAVTTAKITDSNITTSKIANDAVTADKIADAVIVTNAEQSGHTPGDTTFFTTSASDGRYFRQDSSETISSGDTWSGSDAYVATTAAIDARIVDLVDDVGGFVAIADETSFPNTNPDVNDGAGTILSIKEIASTRTPTAGTVTISSGTLGGSTVTITGCGSTVLSAGYGVLVETTTTLNTYTFHRLTPKATEVTTVAGISGDITTVAANDANITSVADDIDTITTNISNINIVGQDLSNNFTHIIDNGSITDSVTDTPGTSKIDLVADDITNVNTVAGQISPTNNISTVAAADTNIGLVGGSIANVNTVASNITGVNSFAERYRVGSADPTTSLDEGDLAYNSTANALKYYNGTSWTSIAPGIANVSDDASPQLGGNLDTNGNAITGSTVSINGATGEFMITATENGPVALRYDNNLKLTTKSDGVDITGELQADSLDIDGNADISGTLQLGSALDGQDNNLNNIGTIDGTNLQLDFGGL